MKIAILAPPWFPIPPIMYGGIEQVVRDLVDGFTELGHEVVLVAPGDSQTPARLIANVPKHLTLNIPEDERNRLHQMIGERSYELALATHPDIIHDHSDYSHPQGLKVPVIRTIHGPAVDVLFNRYADMSDGGDDFICISHRQRELYEARARERGRTIRILGVVHNPLNSNQAIYRTEKEHFAFFIGRADWEKGPDIAIRVARDAEIPLVMSLRVAPYEQPYFDAHVRPLLGPNVNLLPEISVEEKFDLISRSQVVLFTSQWEEPFGLVMTESMACGTPVIAFPRGAAPEIIKDGVTGFLRDTESAMAQAVNLTSRIDPAACRNRVIQQFSPRAAAEAHVALYKNVLGANPKVGLRTR